MHAIRISSTPWFFNPFRIESQNLALSFCPIYIPRTSFLPDISIPMAIYTAYFTIGRRGYPIWDFPRQGTAITGQATGYPS